MTDRQPIRHQGALLFAWLSILVFVYPIPHTIALRNLLLVAGLTTIAVARKPWRTCCGLSSADWSLASRFAVGLYLALTAWIVLQSAIISPFAAESLASIWGDWITALLVAITGFLVIWPAHHTARSDGAIGITAVVFALSGHLLWLLAYQLWRWYQAAEHVLGMTPFAQRDYHSGLVVLLIGLLLADLLCRRLGLSRLVRIPTPVSIALATAALVATVTLQTRNGVVVSGLLAGLAATVFIYSQHRRFGAETLALLGIAVVAVGLFGATIARSDSRWERLAISVKAGLNTSANLYWLDPEMESLPLGPDCLPVDESAYLRTAWATVGNELLGRHPFGVGYGHKAFGRAIQIDYKVDTGLESSHSGLLDFALANGLPGLFLWIGLSAALMYLGWQRFRRYEQPEGLALTIAVFGYLLRCLLDGHLSGFRLEMYALIVGLLLVPPPSGRARCA